MRFQLFTLEFNDPIRLRLRLLLRSGTGILKRSLKGNEPTHLRPSSGKSEAQPQAFLPAQTLRLNAPRGE